MPQDGEHSLDFKQTFCTCSLRCKLGGVDGRWIPDRTYRDHKHKQRLLDGLVQGLQGLEDEQSPDESAFERLNIQDENLEEAPDLQSEPLQTGSQSDQQDAEQTSGVSGFLPEEIQLIKLILELFNLSSEASLSNATVSKLLSWAFADNGSLAALLHNDWKQVSKNFGIPTSYDQLASFLHRLGTSKLGAPQRWRYHTDPNGSWHLFSPSAADDGVPCPYCPDAPQRPLWRDCNFHTEQCKDCDLRRRDCKEMLLISQQSFLKAQCSTIQGCETLLAAVRDHESWMGKDPEQVHEPQSEIWHGKAFREKSSFLDPSKSYMLPLSCPTCNERENVYCSKAFDPPFFAQADSSMWSETSQKFVTVCPQCSGRIEATREDLLRQGSVYNVLLGLHEDGFQASRTTERNAAVLDIFPLTASSRDRASKSKQLLWPMGFPPAEDIPNGPDGLDFFLLAVTLDFLDSFLEGFEAPFALPSEKVFPGLPKSAAYQPVRIHTQLLCTMADQPAQSDLAKTKRSGYHVSRKCRERGELNEKKMVVYGSARLRGRAGCAVKSAAEYEKASRRHLEADSESAAERKAIGEETGVLGFPMLQILYSAYRFNSVTDSPNDWTHTGPLNQVKGTLADLLIPEKGESPNRGKPASQRDPAAGPTMTVADVAQGYNRIRFTRQLSAGRKPPDPSEKSWGSLKAEDLQKLAEHALESMTAGFVGLSQFAILSLVARIQQLVFRTEAWGREERSMLARMCLAKQIRCDDLYGARGRPLEHEAAFHVLQDLLRFGPVRNYWTERNERYIKRLTRIPNNGKEYEATFARREYLSLVASHFEVLLFENNLRKTGETYSSLAWKALDGHFEGGCVFVNSQVQAKRIFEDLPLLTSSSQGPWQNEVLLAIKGGGVLIGPHPRNWRPRSFRALSSFAFLGVRKLLLKGTRNGAGSQSSLRNQAVQQKSITLNGVNFALGDYVVLRDGSDEQFGRLEKIVVVPGMDQKWHAFIQCAYFKILFENSQRILGAPFHNMVMLGDLQSPRNSSCIKFARDLVRHFIPYPVRDGLPGSAPRFHAIQTDRKEQQFRAADVYIPVYPQEGDVVRVPVRADSASFVDKVSTRPCGRRPVEGVAFCKTVRQGQRVDFGLVTRVDTRAKQATVHWLRPYGQPAELLPGTPTTWELWPTRGRGSFAVHNVSWDDMLDVVEGVERSDDDGRLQFHRIRGPTKRSNGTVLAEEEGNKSGGKALVRLVAERRNGGTGTKFASVMVPRKRDLFDKEERGAAEAESGHVAASKGRELVLKEELRLLDLRLGRRRGRRCRSARARPEARDMGGARATTARRLRLRRGSSEIDARARLQRGDVRARETWANVDARREAETGVWNASSGRHWPDDDVHGGHVGDAPQRKVALAGGRGGGPPGEDGAGGQDQVMIRSTNNATVTRFRFCCGGKCTTAGRVGAFRLRLTERRRAAKLNATAARRRACAGQQRDGRACAGLQREGARAQKAERDSRP
ncbi:hypothetical protein KFL_001170120 [Klebsormidium nitens]|uniref:Uncharacterized protein n=1 Tax=Klebsormidium nitens TaxID=105231 RepID=A0A1Y1I3B8_KLENI|nr:hypothetical protein KFL_001170120 [Klebsormidium nitens]|eukprot:GAQ82608.1 hypothetical protein KFL_001170120 [Klebsormidium nitens]